MQGEHRREHWRSRLGIIFATSGSAIGLGTLWRLPYLMGQGGGGAFIVLFLLFTLLLGLPLFIAELALGKLFQKSVVSVFNQVPSESGGMRLFGSLALVSTILIAGWYGVVSGWGINYLLMALTDAFNHKSQNDFVHIFTEFRQSGSINLLWQVVFVFSTFLILVKGVRNGIEHYSKVFFTLLFMLIFGLFIYSTTLSGFKQAFHYIIYPDFSKLNGEIVLSAMGLSLFSLSLGQGIMVTYGSYLSKQQSVFKTAGIVSLSVLFISVLISLMIFPMIFTFGFPPEAGEGLLFITMPYVTEMLPGSMAISSLFFILLIFAALTSYMGQLEVLVSSFMDWGLSRIKAASLAATIAFLMGVPTALMLCSENPYPSFEHIFHRSFLAVNYIIIDWLLLLFALGTCAAVGYKLKREALAETLDQDPSGILFNIWYFFIRFFVPLSILVVVSSRLGFF